MLTWIKRAGAGRVVLPSEVPSAGRGAASPRPLVPQDGRGQRFQPVTADQLQLAPVDLQQAVFLETLEHAAHRFRCQPQVVGDVRSEEHTSELQSLMRISYAVFCLKKKKLATIISE